MKNFFIEISQLKDQLLSIGVNLDDDELIQIVVDGISSAWESLLVVVNGCEVHLIFEILWHDYL